MPHAADAGSHRRSQAPPLLLAAQALPHLCSWLRHQLRSPITYFLAGHGCHHSSPQHRHHYTSFSVIGTPTLSHKTQAPPLICVLTCTGSLCCPRCLESPAASPQPLDANIRRRRANGPMHEAESAARCTLHRKKTWEQRVNGFGKKHALCMF